MIISPIDINRAWVERVNESPKITITDVGSIEPNNAKVINILNGIVVSPAAYAAKSNDIGIIRHQKMSCGPSSFDKRSTFWAFFSPIMIGT